MRVPAEHVLLILSCTVAIGQTTVWNMCGTQWYSPYMGTCCNYILYPHHSPGLAWYTACCGDTAYNTVYQMCCDHRIWSIVSPNQVCCGSSIYFTDSQLCCNDVVQSLSGMWQPACCGQASYDQGYSKCCDENVVLSDGMTQAECCGNLSYDQAYSKCCDDNVVSSAGMIQAECCGSSVFDAEEFKCCDGITVLKYQACFSSLPNIPIQN